MNSTKTLILASLLGVAALGITYYFTPSGVKRKNTPRFATTFKTQSDTPEDREEEDDDNFGSLSWGTDWGEN